jgi:hypothetical protein
MKGAIYQDAVKIVEESDGKIARINGNFDLMN